MANATLDPHLFAPSKDATPLSSLTNSSTPLSELLPTQSAQRSRLFVEPPILPPDQKARYQLFDGRMADFGSDTDEVDQILYEEQSGDDIYYFAGHEGGRAHKFLAKAFELKYPNLVAAFEQRKLEGHLPEFDPWGPSVHPNSRNKLLITLPPKSNFGKKLTPQPIKKRKIVTSDDTDEVPDSEDTSESEDDEDYNGSGRIPRAARRQRIIRKDLPFSPRKTRSRPSFNPVASDDDLGGYSETSFSSQIRTRRSVRTRKSTKINVAEDDYMDDSDGFEDSEAYEEGRSSRRIQIKKKPKKRIERGIASRAAYGNFRVVVDLEYDDQSDDENAPLRAHRDICEKCHRKPTHILLAEAGKKHKKSVRKKGSDDDLLSDTDEIEKLTALGGWVRCLKCPVTAHWKCLAKHQQQEILRAARERDRASWQERLAEMGRDAATEAMEPVARINLQSHLTTEFICGSCMKGGVCMGCGEMALESSAVAAAKIEGSSVGVTEVIDQADSTIANVKVGEDVTMTDGTVTTSIEQIPLPDVGHTELLFRCFTCKRLSHYCHLPVPSQFGTTELDPVTLAEYYQSELQWLCADCSSLTYSLDKILAWRPYPEGAIEPLHPVDKIPDFKSQMPREYLVKWQDRSYRRIQWVPHMWLVAMNAAKLKNFLTVGARVELLSEPVPENRLTDTVGDERAAAVESGPVVFEVGIEESRDSSPKPTAVIPVSHRDAVPDAERRIPPAWKTIDRVLDVLFWYPEKRKRGRKIVKKKIQNTRGKGKRKADNYDDEDDEDGDGDEDDERLKDELDAVFQDGEMPKADVTEAVDDWERRTKSTLTMEDIDKAIWIFVKWCDLGYDEATWDSPPRPGEPGYAAFKFAFQRYISSRSVEVIKKSTKQCTDFDNRVRDQYRWEYSLSKGSQPDLGQSSNLKLMPFQIDGVNWLCNNWWNLQQCILADEMGLGKTVQIVSFIGIIVEKWDTFPALVVVPNSTITNWVREFERWAPQLRVVPFHGESKARDVIKQFELFHKIRSANTTGAKYHVLVTTYESVIGKDFAAVFSKTPRWEVLVVDEGQRLKSDSSLLFKKLNLLNTVHRIIMTGTPLNNNIRELFNLMNFLDPEEWHDLEKLEKEHEELTEDLVRDLHNRLRPYFLRRIKSEVLQLPPKNEVIVPVSMTPLQKEVYRSILSQNLSLLKSLSQTTSTTGSSVTKSNLNNMLMQLRKCMQHPYLNADNIEPRGLSLQETQEKLVSASAKLRFLKSLLPKLKERGHRVLLFSQFSIALDIIEDFLVGEGIKFLRLDGHTKQADRQKGMDEFNLPDSDVFIYILTTRAGGVGINLWSADTVIIFDPDFNPHQDLQAIARAHRYGQKKTCLVFKLMVKDSAEERIMQTGKKKLVLDHLIVQKMDDEDSVGEDVQSILTFGAKALFDDDQGTKDINYSDHDIEKLIEKTEKEGDTVEPDKGTGFSFAFAKVWSADKDSLEEMMDETQEDQNQSDAWEETLRRMSANQETAKMHEVTGRGARRRAAAAIAAQQIIPELDESPKDKQKKRRRTKSQVSDESDAYTGPRGSDAEDSDTTDPIDLAEVRDLANAINQSGSRTKFGTPPSDLQALPSNQNRASAYIEPLSSIPNHSKHDSAKSQLICGLCGRNHGGQICYMTESSTNLAEYRQILLVHGGDEPLAVRRAAIQAIDETLYKRGDISLIDGQPLNLVQDDPYLQPPPRRNGTNSRGRTPKRGKSKQVGSAQLPPAPAALAGPLDTTSLPPPRPHLYESSDTQMRNNKSVASPSVCSICGRSPHHLVKDCPVVAEGPARISQEIKKLEVDPSMDATVQILKKILTKQKKREVAISAGVMLRD